MADEEGRPGGNATRTALKSNAKDSQQDSVSRSKGHDSAGQICSAMSAESPTGLCDEHRQILLDAGISPEIIEERGYVSVRANSPGYGQDKWLEQQGFTKRQRRYVGGVPGLLIPLLGVDGHRWGWQLRHFCPDNGLDAHFAKYFSPHGQHMHVDVPPQMGGDLRYPKETLYVTEGSKKADAAWSKLILTVALLGVDCWSGTDEETGGKGLPLQDWKDIVLRDRKVVIAFDSDIRTNRGVAASADRFAKWLKHKGADVHVLFLPSGQNGEKVGLDDYLAQGRDEFDLEKLARPYAEVSREQWWRQALRGPRSGASNAQAHTGARAEGACRRIRLISADEVADGIPEWAWTYKGEGRIQRSVTTLFGGRPGAGKSTAARRFAADYTRGTVEGCWHGQPQNVAYIAAEEPLDLVVKPSLRAHEADMGKVFFPEVTVVDHNGKDKHAKLLSIDDEDTLTELFLEHGIKVVIVDPVMATIQSTADVHRNNEVREYMEPWTRIAERIDGIVIAIVHLRKATTGDIVAAITGSSAFGEVARCVFGFAKDPNSDDERVMSQAKNSCGLEDLSLTYKIPRVPITTDSGQSASMGVFTIVGDSDTTVSEVLSTQRRQERLTLSMGLLVQFVENREKTTPTDLVEAGLAADNKQASQKLKRLQDRGLITQLARGE